MSVKPKRHWLDGFRRCGVLSRRDGLNHFFFPECGGQQITEVEICADVLARTTARRNQRFHIRSDNSLIHIRSAGRSHNGRVRFQHIDVRNAIALPTGDEVHNHYVGSQ
jgi:hypothetical protein